jgi:uncharacterized integral membrane protein
MFEQIITFLKNEIAINWVAPFVVTSIPALFFKLVSDRQKSKNIISTIKVANRRFVDVVRPFFIQEITLNIKMLEDIRKAILIEYSIEDNMLYSLQQLKEMIILDIAETRFLTEDKKDVLINCVYREFEKLKSEDLKSEKIIDEKYNEVINREHKKLRNVSITLLMFIYIIVIFAIIIYYKGNVKFNFIKTEILFPIIAFMMGIMMVILEVITPYRLKIAQKLNKKDEVKESDKNKTD